MPNLSLILSALALGSVAGTQLFDFQDLVDIEGTIAIEISREIQPHYVFKDITLRSLNTKATSAW
jgi:hypothetical protein